MHHSRIILENVDSATVQQNIKLYSHRRYGPYQLVLERADDDSICGVRVECQGRRLGRVPERFAKKLARAINAGVKHEARPRKLIQRQGTDYFDLMIKIYPVPNKKKLTREEYLERKKWQKVWIKRHGSSKWYS